MKTNDIVSKDYGDGGEFIIVFIAEGTPRCINVTAEGPIHFAKQAGLQISDLTEAQWLAVLGLSPETLLLNIVWLQRGSVIPVGMAG